MGKAASTSSNNRKRQYKGVRRRSWGSTPEAAARAYDAALLCLKGSSADFNFPAAASSLRHHHSPGSPLMSPKSIQRAAAEAANAGDAPAGAAASPYHVSPPPPVHQHLISPHSSSSFSASSSEDAGVAADELKLVQYCPPNSKSTPTLEEEMQASQYPPPDFWPDFGLFPPPKYGDHMLNNGCSSFTPSSQMEDQWEEEVGIHLWSF